MFQEIKASLQQLYLEDKRPWLVGFSGDVGPSSARPRSYGLSCSRRSNIVRHSRFPHLRDPNHR